jgi:fatty-acyl-CoA synthase
MRMKGSMMDYPLTLQAIMERIPKVYAPVEIVSRRPDGSLHRYTYMDFYRRTRALAEALHRAGMKPGDRVGTLCWNHSAHLEAYFGVPPPEAWCTRSICACIHRSWHLSSSTRKTAF